MEDSDENRWVYIAGSRKNEFWEVWQDLHNDIKYFQCAGVRRRVQLNKQFHYDGKIHTLRVVGNFGNTSQRVHMHDSGNKSELWCAVMDVDQMANGNGAFVLESCDSNELASSQNTKYLLTDLALFEILEFRPSAEESYNLRLRNYFTNQLVDYEKGVLVEL